MNAILTTNSGITLSCQVLEIPAGEFVVKSGKDEIGKLSSGEFSHFEGYGEVVVKLGLIEFTTGEC